MILYFNIDVLCTTYICKYRMSIIMVHTILGIYDNLKKKIVKQNKHGSIINNYRHNFRDKIVLHANYNL